MNVQERVAERRPLEGGISFECSILLVGGEQLHVRHARISVLSCGVGSRGSQGCLLPLQFTLDSQGLHLIHLTDALLQVLTELGAIVFVPRIEGDEDFVVHSVSQFHQIRVI